MKRSRPNLAQIKRQIELLKGQDVTLSINRGRKRFETFLATIDSVYPSVFTIKTVNQPKQSPVQTFSYFDVMCGDVTILDEKAMS